MADTSDWGFPKGNVPQTLHKILYPALTDHEVEAIVVCLMAHLLIENKLNGILYRCLIQAAPVHPESDKQSKAEDKLWGNIVKIDFAKKYSLVEPFFAEHFPDHAASPWKINDLRNTIFHGRAIRDARFEGQPISNEKTVEKIFLAAQFASERFDKFEELIDDLQALAKRWSKRLAELGQPLL